MRETQLSNPERNFVNKAIQEGTRLDGREFLEGRAVKIYFGDNWGCCMVTLGQTRVIAQVTCDVQQPKISRPNEGMVYINVELNPIAAQFFESGKQSDAAVLINRQLEKCIKDSKCIDLESLCIVADKQVWNLRVDVNIINHDGNLVGCASIATLAALMHFHRPDVTSTGENIIIHPFSEKDPLPLTLFHRPVCVSLITFEDGSTVLDPTYLEERVGVAQLIMGINSYRELCSLNFDYLTKTSMVKDVISSVSNYAANYAATLVAHITKVVSQDVQARYKKETSNVCRFKECITVNKITALCRENISIKLKRWNIDEKPKDNDVEVEMEENPLIIKSGVGTAELITENNIKIGEGGPSTWNVSESSEDEPIDNVELVAVVPQTKNVIDDIEITGDSEEEDTEIIDANDIKQ